MSEKLYTINDLFSIGISSQDITKLKNKGFLIELKDGNFKFSDEEKLFLFTYDMFYQKKYFTALHLLLGLSEVYPDSHDIRLRILYIYIALKDYEKTFDIFRELLSFENENIIKEVKVLLLLVSNLCKLPEDLNSIVFNMNLDDILVDSKDYSTKYTNKVRSMVYNKNFDAAYVTVKQAFGDYSEHHDFKLDLDCILISRNKDKSYIDRDYILFYAIKKNYFEIINYLEDKSKNTTLSNRDKQVLKLCQIIIDAKKTGIIPKEKPIENNKLDFDSIIDANHFKDAFLYIVTMVDNYEKDVFYYLINDILDLYMSKKTNKRNNKK